MSQEDSQNKINLSDNAENSTDHEVKHEVTAPVKLQLYRDGKPIQIRGGPKHRIIPWLRQEINENNENDENENENKKISEVVN